MICKKCGNEFEPVSGLKSFCSLKCRNSREWSWEDNRKKSLAAKNSDKVKKKKVVEKTVKSLWELSHRTVSKILRRANVPCQCCGYDRAPRDVHHILPRKQGGGNENSNLVILCPNCHREAHNGLISVEELKQKTIDITFSNYMDYYHEGYGGYKKRE